MQQLLYLFSLWTVMLRVGCWTGTDWPVVPLHQGSRLTHRGSQAFPRDPYLAHSGNQAGTQHFSHTHSPHHRTTRCYRFAMAHADAEPEPKNHSVQDRFSA